MAGKTAGKTSPQPALPQDMDAEEAVIGCILQAPELLDKIDLYPDDFLDISCRDIFKTFIELRSRNQEVNEATLHTESGVEAWKMRALAGNALMPHLHNHVARVKELSLLRMLIVIGGILAHEAHVNQDPQTTYDHAMQMLSELKWLKTRSRFANFTNGVVRTSEHPIYTFTVEMYSQTKGITLESEDLDKPLKVKRVLRETFHVNPILPSEGNWDKFINTLVQQAKKEEAPKETRAGEELNFWLKEWYKTSEPATSVDDLVRGYIARDGFIYFQAERILQWLSDSKVKGLAELKVNKLWAFVSQRGGQRDKAIKLEGKTRRFWGLPAEFFLEDDVDISFLGGSTSEI